MKIKLQSLLLFGLTAIMVSACTSSPCGLNKNYFLNNFDAFVEEIKDKDLPYNAEEWVKHDKKFTQFKDECYKHFEDKLTKEEKEAFTTNTVKYYWLRYGSGLVNQVLDKDSEVVENLLDGLREAWDGSEEDIDKIINDLKGEVDKIDKEKFEDLIRDMGGDLEEWGKKIEEIFKDVEININEDD